MMGELGKTPFRLLLETEGFDSQASFELPSPKLEENSQAPTPELFYVDLEERESRTDLYPLYVECPLPTLPSGESLTPQKPFFTPQAASGAVPLSLQAHLESVHLRLRKRSTPLSQFLSRSSKPEAPSLRKTRDSRLETTVQLGKRVTPLGKLKAVDTVKTGRIRASEPRKPIGNLRRESPGGMNRVLGMPLRSIEVRAKAKGDMLSPKVKPPELRTEPIKMVSKLADRPKRRLK